MSNAYMVHRVVTGKYVAAALDGEITGEEATKEICEYQDRVSLRLSQGAHQPADQTVRTNARSLAGMEPKDVRWLWEPRIPLGMVTVLAGAKGSGKGLLSTQLIAAITTGGRLPVEAPDICVPIPRGRVLLINAEDPVAETLVPRLQAAGADMGEIVHLSTVQRGDDGPPIPITLADHWSHIEAQIQEVRPTALFIDTLTSHCGADLLSNSEMAPIMARLSEAAERHGIAIVLIHHVVKSPHSRATSDVSGASCIATTSRSILMVGCDETKKRRALWHLDSNVGTEAPPIGYEVMPWAWTETDLTLHEVRHHRPKSKNTMEEGRKIVADLLENGPVRSSDIEDGLAFVSNNPRSVAKAARAELRAETEKIGAAWWTYLPEHAAQMLAIRANHKGGKDAVSE